MALKQSKRGKKPITFLEKGESIRIIGARGKPVKRVRSGRQYVLQVIKNRKLVGYVNTTKRGKPVPREFTRSVVQRLKYTRSQKIHQAPKNGSKFKISNKTFLKNQISPKLLREIRKNKGKAFNFRIEFKNNKLISHSIFINGRITDENLINLITSDLLYTLGRDHFRISPKAESVDKSNTKRIEQAELQLQFTSILKSKGAKKWRKKKKVTSKTLIRKRKKK